MAETETFIEAWLAGGGRDTAGLAVRTGSVARRCTRGAALQSPLG